jgi:hypothetical protein
MAFFVTSIRLVPPSFMSPFYKESPCITWISARIITFPYHHRKSSGMKK